jgi:hypothetical protein
MTLGKTLSPHGLARVAAGALLLVLLPALAPAEPTQWRTEDGGNGHWYEAVAVGASGISWDSANAAALATGGYLASITSAQENDFAFSLIVNRPELWRQWGDIPGNNTFGPWIGGFQMGNPPTDVGWQWASGETWAYTSWASGEPNDYAGYDENRLLFYAPYGNKAPVWNDVNEQSPWMAEPYGYVVEMAPEPATLAILALGGLTLLRRSRR